MNAAPFARVRALFDRLCDLPASDALRAAEEADLDPADRALLIGMLRADDTGGAAPDHGPGTLVLPVVSHAYIGQRIGPWRIVRVLGVGGMGRVFLARRDDGLYDGEVAVKYLADSSTPGLFTKERLALARLSHAGIARLIDAGDDDQGRPYLVMEYVAGALVDDWCRTRRLGTRDRIRLVIAALRAIAHAHGQLVLHRDLKPSNLIVAADGQLKVLDFGIAKLLDAAPADIGQTAARYFTLRYAAPEQISGEPIGIGTDLFALALVLYELLCDEHPFVATTADRQQIAECVLTREPTPLRRREASAGIRRELGDAGLRDLDAVLSRALARDASQRFGSAHEFADELARVIADQPVLSREPGLMQAMARRVRRHPVAAGLLAIAVCGLVASTIVAALQSARARAERDLAVHEAARSERMARFLTSLFESVRPGENGGRTPSIEDLLERGQQQLERDTADDPDLRIRLALTLADSWRALGQYERAGTLLERLHADAAATGVEPALAARIQMALGRVRSFEGRWQDAGSALQAGIDHLGTTSADHVLRAQLERQLAITWLNRDAPDKARVLAEQARSRLAGDPAIAWSERVDTDMLLATVSFMEGDLPAALAAYQRIVLEYQQHEGPDSPKLITGLNNLAAIEARTGAPAEAERHFREAVAIATRVFGPENREVALPRLGLGMALRAQGKAAPALAELDAAVAIYRRWSGPDHAETAYAELLRAETRWLAEQAVAGPTPVDGTPEPGALPVAALGVGSERHCRALWLGFARARGRPYPGDDPERRSQCVESLAPTSTTPILVDWWRGQASLPDLRHRAAALAARDQLLEAALARATASPPWPGPERVE